jgi:hypothetical protein
MEMRKVNERLDESLKILSFNFSFKVKMNFGKEVER